MVTRERRLGLCVLVAAVLVLSGGVAQATLFDVAPLGDPISGGSWYQPFRVWVLEPSDPVAGLAIASNGNFAAPYMSGFLERDPPEDPPVDPAWNTPLPSWGVTSGSSTSASASASDPDDYTRDMKLLVHFNDPQSDPFTFSMTAYAAGNASLGTKVLSWNGEGFWNVYSAPPAVPEPLSCALLAVAMGGVGLAVRKRRRR